MMLYDRERELNKLEEAYRSATKEMVVIYGRRRLGKTTLLRSFANRYKSFFFSCPMSTEEEGLRLFQQQLLDCFNDSSLEDMIFPGWPEALRYLFDRASRAGFPVILDEIPYLFRSVPGIDSHIQHLWDAHEGTLKLIFSGSTMSVMRERMFGAQAPLYGRRTGQIQFSPMGFADISQFYSDSLSFEQRAYMYAIYGGVPAYAERAAQFLDYKQSLLHLILDQDAVFYQEPEFMLRQELQQPGTYFSLLHALSAGRTKPNEIAQYAGIPRSSVNKYLDVLSEMYLIRREIPITEHRPDKSTKGLYVLADNLMRFWFRYVYPYTSIVELGRGAELLHTKVQPNLNEFMGPVYEEICRQELKYRGEELIGWVPLRIGRYWDAHNEIDIVAEDPTAERVAFVECKWGKQVDSVSLLKDLRRKADMVPEYHGWNRSYFIMSRTGTTQTDHIQIGD